MKPTVRYMMVLAPGVSSVQTAQRYRPFSNDTLEVILESACRGAPVVQWPSRPRRFSNFVIFGKCFETVCLNDLNDDLCQELAKGVLSALVDSESLSSCVDRVALHKAIERYYDSDREKRVIGVGGDAIRSELPTAFVVKSEEGLRMILMIELLSGTMTRSEKMVLEVLADA